MSGLEIYSGKFKYEGTNEEYQGELQIDKINIMITLTLTISSSDLHNIPRLPLENEIKVIYGKLLSGKSVILYDCYVLDESNHKNFIKAGLNYTTQVIKASYLFETDITLGPEGLLITSAQVDFGNILEWANLCHYTWEGDGTTLNPVWIESEPVSINIRDDLEVKFIPSRNIGVLNNYQEKLELNQNVYSKFQYKQPIKWDDFLEDIKKVEYLIGFGLQRKVSFEGIKCQLLEDDSEYDRFWDDEVTLGIGRIENIDNQHSYFFLYNLEAIAEESHFSKWIEYYEKLKPILDLYFLILDNQYYLTSELVFLNLVQALETFHARFITDDVKEYVTRAKTLVANYLHHEEWLDFLCDKGQRSSRSIYLKSRLADLMFANGQHLEMVDDTHQGIQKIVDTRNYYTHYDPNKLERSFTKSELPVVNYKLRLLLEFHIQKLIGFDEDSLKKKYLENVRRLR